MKKRYFFCLGLGVFVTFVGVSCAEKRSFAIRSNPITEQQARSTTSGMHIIVQNRIQPNRTSVADGNPFLNGRICAWPDSAPQVQGNSRHPDGVVCLDLVGTVFSGSTEHYIVSLSEFEMLYAPFSRINFEFVDSERTSSSFYGCWGGSPAFEELGILPEHLVQRQAVRVEVTARHDLSYSCSIAMD